MLQQLNVKLSGLPLSPTTPVLFFMPGFPDKHDSFDAILPKFADTHTLAVAVMPDMEITTRSLGGGRLTQKWGYSFPEIVDAAAASCRALLPESKKLVHRAAPGQPPSRALQRHGLSRRRHVRAARVHAASDRRHHGLSGVARVRVLRLAALPRPRWPCGWRCHVWNLPLEVDRTDPVRIQDTAPSSRGPLLDVLPLPPPRHRGAHGQAAQTRLPSGQGHPAAVHLREEEACVLPHVELHPEH
mmetsp:Transcript_72901/g.207688  ORF Transcript_72901/g.207688 Transcript_72901/m.207688 type:complete len:243 (-) Transcript_72901:231-959(-)